MEATEGLDALIEAMGRTEKRALKSQLIRLMSHVIQWKCQPDRRSSIWAITIRSARREIRAIQEEVPSFNRNFIQSIWDICFSDTVEDAEDEMGRDCELISLSWEEVFDEEYRLV